MTDVPLVIYENGERKVVGEAFVSDDGKIEARVHDASLSEVLSTGLVFGTSLSLFREEDI